MATVYKANGEALPLRPRGKYFSLPLLQKIVGGDIQLVYLNDNTILVLNEEGKLENLPLNVRATEIFRKNFPLSDDVIVGDAVITESKYMK
jgi:hypothetical protein